MIRCYITDRHQVGGLEPLLHCVSARLAEGVEYLQIREKDLSARDLSALVRRVMQLSNPFGARVLVNSRVDVALACGAHGVHLPSHSIPVEDWRRITPPGFIIGVSCHTVDELKAVGAADFAFYGPVFTPLSKSSFGPPVGLDGLRDACAAAPVPVLALGGITWQNAEPCLEAGAAGIAAITLFQCRESNPVPNPSTGAIH